MRQSVLIALRTFCWSSNKNLSEPFWVWMELLLANFLPLPISLLWRALLILQFTWVQGEVHFMQNVLINVSDWMMNWDRLHVLVQSFIDLESYVEGCSFSFQLNAMQPQVRSLTIKVDHLFLVKEFHLDSDLQNDRWRNKGLLRMESYYIQGAK